jgi:hypothetical protein
MASGGDQFRRPVARDSLRIAMIFTELWCTVITSSIGSTACATDMQLRHQKILNALQTAVHSLCYENVVATNSTIYGQHSPEDQDRHDDATS